MNKKEQRDVTKFTGFYQDLIKKIWMNYDKATMPKEEFDSKYPVRP